MLETVRAALAEALDTEHRAEATYESAIAAFGPVEPFVEVVELSRRNTDELLRLFERHGLEPPVNDWRGRVAKPADVAEACRTARTVAAETAERYEHLLSTVETDDVRATFQRLRDALRAVDLPILQRCRDRTQHLDAI